MTTTVDAIYRDGKLVLEHPLPLADQARVTVTIETSADAERAIWHKISEQSLMKTWGDPADDVFNELLAK